MQNAVVHGGDFYAASRASIEDAREQVSVIRGRARRRSRKSVSLSSPARPACALVGRQSFLVLGTVGPEVGFPLSVMLRPVASLTFFACLSMRPLPFLGTHDAVAVGRVSLGNVSMFAGAACEVVR